MSAPQDALHEQDPDYVSSVPNNDVQQKVFEQTARVNTARKLREIFDNEFSKEIDAKEKEVLEIQDRLQESLKTLHLLRYVVVTDYYTRKQCQLPEVQTENKQSRIHPAIKQLIGKTPRGIKSNFIDGPSGIIDNPVEKEEEKPSCSKTETVTSGTKRARSEEPEKEPAKKVPRYIPPKSSSPEPMVPSRGGHNKVRRKVIIGNISKWIPPDWRNDEASHKWTVYVRRCKDDVDVSEIVSKVRFFLHPTYKPHDVVEIATSPFHLTRRGWGEFPIRIQLHFKNPLDKPKDVIHNLKLDQTYTGIQTLGSEAVYGFWLHSRNAIPAVPDAKDQKEKDSTQESLTVPSATKSVELTSTTKNHPKLNVSKNVSKDEKLKLCIRKEHDYALMDYVVENNRTIVHLPNGHTNDKSATEKTATNGFEKMSEDELATVASNANKPPNEAHSILSVADSLKNCPAKTQLLNITIPATFEAKKKSLLIVKNKAGTNSMNVKSLDNGDKSLLKQNGTSNNARQIVTTNTFIFNPNTNVPALQIVEGYKNNVQSNGGLGRVEDIVEKERKCKDKQKVTKKDVWDEKMRSIMNYKFKDTVSLVKFIMNRVPLITAEASDPEYKRLHPYTCSSYEEFLACNVGKQKYFEWHRAKLVRSFMKKCVTSSEDLWTVKEIMIWARLHGYTPVVPNPNSRKTMSMKSTADQANSMKNTTVFCTRTETTELNEWLAKCQTENDSQSDVEVDIESIVEENPNPKRNAMKNTILSRKADEEDSEFLELPSQLKPLHDFVSEVVRERGGVKLENETIVPGMRHCAAARVMMQAVQCLVEDISRFANAQATNRIQNCDGHAVNPAIITKIDVRNALTMREEFDIFTNVGLGTKQKVIDYNSD